jgi:methionyl-tRNA synthetase
MRGNEAYIVSGSDVYESHVERKAVETGTTIENVCNSFHELIQIELSALDIEYDLNVNPLDASLAPGYMARNRRTIDELARLGAVETVSEQILYSSFSNRYVAGCWISGICPACKANTGSYFCEECGTSYKPQDLLEVQSKGGEDDLRRVTAESLFLRIANRESLWKQIAKMGVPAKLVAVVDQYLQAQGGLVRLTNPGRWGVPYGATDQVIFTYTALFSYSIFCAELLAHARGWGETPFHPDSDFVTIASFGIDNTIPYLVGVLVSAIELGTVRPFDYYLTNYFYHLEGRKFSTSRTHLICAHDLIENAGVSSDSLRYFLSKTNPETETKDFRVSEFIRTNNEVLCSVVGRQIRESFSALNPEQISEAPPILTQWLSDLVEAQELDLAFPSPNLSRALSAVDTFSLFGRTLEQTPANAYWWLKGWVLLAYPFMPEMSQRIWDRLGYTGPPHLGAYLERPQFPIPEQVSLGVSEISLRAVEKCVYRG